MERLPGTVDVELVLGPSSSVGTATRSSLAGTVENVAMADLAVVLELLYSARHRYRTVHGLLES